MSYPNNKPENFVNYKYYNINEMKNLKTCKDKKSLFLFHLSICSLPNNFDDLQYLIQSTNIYFDAIPISESRIDKNKSANQ